MERAKARNPLKIQFLTSSSDFVRRILEEPQLERDKILKNEMDLPVAVLERVRNVV